VRWARQVASRFPDGQLFVNLNGFGPSGPPMTAAAAIRRFLDDLGIAPERIPASPEAQASLYRSLLADQRMLIVLDNASDPAQVRPLLPGGPGCLALVTSRRPLTGLAAADGARLVALDVLTAAEAGELLAGRLDRDRVAAEPAAAAELTELCARLPLALSVAAAHAAARPQLPLAALAAELRDARTRLDALDTGDAATDVRTVLSWSCQQLSEPAARLFRLLGVHAGPDVTAAAAASLADQDREQAARLLAELTAASLLAEHAPGRYRGHDLLRAYAAEQARGRESAAALHAATGRVLDHYLHTAYAASRLLYPHRDPIALGAPPPWAQPAELADRQQAEDWFQAERHVILAAVAQAADAGFHAHAWQLAWTVATFFSWRGYWQEQAQTQQAALGAARLAADRTGQTHAHRFLGQALRRLGDGQLAGEHLDAALQLSRQLGDDTLAAHIHMELTEIFEQRDDSRTALHHAEQALRLYRSAGHQMGVAIALNCAGWQHALLGHYAETLDCSGRAAELFREQGNRLGQGASLDSIGYAHLRLGQYAAAIACCQQALEAQGDSGDLGVKAMALRHLGDACQAAGDGESARRAWRQALTLYDSLEDPAAAELRSRLGAGAGPGTR
jgi:tetratricopeptide (TPR) repeat protein